MSIRVTESREVVVTVGKATASRYASSFDSPDEANFVEKRNLISLKILFLSLVSLI